MNGSEDGKWSDLLNKDLILNADVFRLNFRLYLFEKSGENGIQEYENMLYNLDFFIFNFKIIKQVVERGFNGFSATTYQLQNDIDGTDFKAGQVFVSYRGTEISAADFGTDTNLAFSFRTGEGPTVTFFNSVIKSESQERQAILYLESSF